MKRLISGLVILASLASCIDPEVVEQVQDGDEIHTGGSGVISKTATGGIAAKNFTQIHMTYSNLTGVPTYEDKIVSEFNAIQLQLPASSDPESLNGFNQLSATRLAFAYCDIYLDKADVRSIFTSSSSDVNAKTLINQFSDMDFENSIPHQEFLAELVAILENKGINAAGADVQLAQTPEKFNQLKMGCAAVLSSSYLTLI